LNEVLKPLPRWRQATCRMFRMDVSYSCVVRERDHVTWISDVDGHKTINFTEL